MRKLIKQAADDKGVKAVVLRVNSPGGSALAAEQIWYELQQLRNKKPLIISMGSYAASGGYYIAAPGDAIIADRMTITGSIGVFGMFVDMGDALRNKLGITVDGVSTSSHSDIGTPFRAMDATERAYFQRSVDDVYTTFVGRVASGRNLTFEQVDAIAEGRVWSATDAHRIGLVDDLGGLAAAINVAADRAGVINDFRIVEITEELTGIQQLFSNMSVSIREQVLRKQLGILYDTWNNIQSLQTHTGLRAELPYTIHIN
jgi:protease-4